MRGVHRKKKKNISSTYTLEELSFHFGFLATIESFAISEVSASHRTSLNNDP